MKLAVLAALAASALFASDAGAESVALGTSVPDTGANKIFVDTFVETLKTTEPDIEVKRFMDSQLGNERELIDLVKLGEIEFEMGSIHPSQYYPELDATAVPYLFADWDEVKAYLNGPIGQKMSDALQQRGNAVPLAYYYQGSRWVTTQGRPFRTVAELNGMKMRMAEIPLWIDVWSGLGATIAPMPSNEVFSAMQTGVIDAQDNMLSNIWGRQLHTVSDYLIDTQHQQAFVTLMVNQDYWEGLSPETQQHIKAAADKAAEVSDAETAKIIKKLVADIKESGVELVEPDASFRADAMPVIERAARKVLSDEAWQAAQEIANGRDDESSQQASSGNAESAQ